MKPERDPVVCPRCPDADPQRELVATPAGPLCRDHAAELAAEMEGRDEP